MVTKNINFAWVITCLLFVPCIFYLPALDYLNLPRELFWLGSGSLLILYSLFRLKEYKIHFDHINKSIVVFLFWALVSVCWAWQPYLSWPRWSILLAAFITFLITRNISNKQKETLLWTFAIQGLLGSIIAFLQVGEIEPFNFISQTEKPGIVMGHRNVAAEYMLITFGATIALISNQYSKYINVSLIINALLILATIVVTKCRGVIGALLIIDLLVCIKIITKQNNLKRKFFVSVGAILLHFTLGYVAILIQPELLNSFSGAKLGSIEMRKSHYSNTLMMAKEHLPTGVGIGNFAINYSTYINSWVPDKPYSDKLILKNVHSDPLECLAELGPIGLILMIMIFYYGVFKYKSESYQSSILKYTIIAQVVNACINFPFQVIQTQLAMAIILGIIHNYNKVKKEDSKSITLSINFSIKFIMCCLVLFYFQFQYKRLNAHINARKGLDHLVSKEHILALPHLRRAVEYTPRNVDIEMLLAYCLKEMRYTTESSSIAENVLGVFPGYLPALNLIGLNSLEINDLNRAIRAFETSYELQPHQEATKVKLGYSYLKFAQELRMRNFFKEAYETEEKLFELQPESAETLLRMIVDQATLKNHNKAQELYEQLPNTYVDPRKYYTRAKMMIAKEDIFSAIEALDRGLEKYPKEKVLENFRNAILNLKVNTKESP
jgi:O-antigen ligase